MNTEEFTHNKDQWFLSNEEWPLVPCPVRKKKLVLLVPHPDDEIFGCAGLLQQWAPLASETLIIYVTSGEASHGYQDADQKAKLANLRRLESRRAIEALELDAEVQVCELHIPDSGVKSFEVELEERLRMELDPSCVVIAPYYRDGHTDHDAIGEIAKKLSESIGFEIYFFPIWMWFWSAPQKGVAVQDHFKKVPMNGDELSRKIKAMTCFESQIVPGKQKAIIPEEFLLHYSRSPFEVLMVH